MPEVEVEVTTTVTAEFEVFCAKCGAGLCGNCTSGYTRGRGHPYIQIEPCERCLTDAYENGKSECV